MRASKRRGRRPRTEPDQAEIKPRWAEIAEIDAEIDAALAAAGLAAALALSQPAPEHILTT